MDTASLRRIVGYARREPAMLRPAVSCLDEQLDSIEAQIAELQRARARIVEALMDLDAADPVAADRLMCRLRTA